MKRYMQHNKTEYTPPDKRHRVESKDSTSSLGYIHNRHLRSPSPPIHHRHLRSPSPPKRGNGKLFSKMLGFNLL